VAAVGQQEFVAPFQKAIGSRYPVLRQEQMHALVFGLPGPGQMPFQTVWRFSDVESVWRVSLAPDFLALETTSYTNRADLLSRFAEVSSSLAEHVAPKVVDRLGVRYIDRLVGDAVTDIAKLVRPEVCGVAGTSLRTHVVHSITESIFKADSTQLLARWGSLPAGATVDPSAIEPINEPSWILDLDMFNVSPVPFSNERLLKDLAHFSERLYTFFRWAVTDEFLRRYGGSV